MKKNTLLYTTIVLFSITLNAQSVQGLQERNGFKDIKMATDISLYDGLVFEKEIEDEKFGTLQVYTRKKDTYVSIGTIPIQELKVTVYNGEVYMIQVIINKDPKMYGGLKKAFGPPKFSPVTNDYFWQSDSLKLVYRAYDKKQLEMLYRSYVIERKLKDEKKEEIEDIASDF